MGYRYSSWCSHKQLRSTNEIEGCNIVDKAVEETMTLAFVTVSRCARQNSRSDRFESTPKIRQLLSICFK